MASFVNEKPFSIHVTGNRTKRLFTGDFTAYRFLSARLILKKDQLLRQGLAGENPLISGQVDLASKLAVIKTGLATAPDWWQKEGEGDGLLDLNVIDEIFSEVNKVQTEADESVVEKAEVVAEDLPEVAAKAIDKSTEAK